MLQAPHKHLSILSNCSRSMAYLCWVWWKKPHPLCMWRTTLRFLMTRKTFLWPHNGLTGRWGFGQSNWWRNVHSTGMWRFLSCFHQLARHKKGGNKKSKLEAQLKNVPSPIHSSEGMQILLRVGVEVMSWDSSQWIFGNCRSSDQMRTWRLRYCLKVKALHRTTLQQWLSKEI